VSSLAIIPPGEDIIEAVASGLKPRERDYSGNIVVFPGKRPAHFLRAAIARRQKSSFIPPRIFSVDDFVEFLCGEAMGIRARRLDPVDALALLYDIHLQAERRIGNGTFTSLETFLPVGMKLVSELEEVHLALLPARRILEVLSAVQYPKFHSLATYYREFYAEVERRGCATRSMLYRSAAEGIEHVDMTGWASITMAGFYALTAAEKRIFLSLKNRENLRFLFQHGVGLREQLAPLGIHVEPPPEEEMPLIRFYKVPDTHGQVFTLAAKLSERVRAGERLDRSTAIVLPSPDALFAVMQHALSLLDEEQYNIALGYPLLRTPVFGFLQSLMKLVASQAGGMLSSEEYLKFVLHPYTKNIRYGGRSDITRVLFHSLEEYLLDEKARWLISLEELEQDERFFTVVSERLSGMGSGTSPGALREHLHQIHSRTISPFLAIRSLKDFARQSIGMLTYISEESTAQLHPFFRPYVERLIELLERISSSLISDTAFEEPSGYLSFLRSLAARENVPFSGTPLTGLQVLGLLETRNLKFDTLYILDASDDIIPGARGEDLLLPQKIRQMLGLETYRDREKLSEYYLMLAIHGARQVHLLYTDDGKKEKSRFVGKLLWARQRAQKKASTIDHEELARYHVTLANAHPAPVRKTPEVLEHMRRNARYSAHALDTYLACPLRFYYQNVLGLREKAEVTAEIDAMGVGKMVHAVLKAFFESTVGKDLRPEHLSAERLGEVVERCCNEEYGSDAAGAAYFLRRQVGEQLGKFLEFYQKPLVERERVMIVGLERTVTVRKHGHTFTGRIDRLELRSGNTHILDYKTGADDAHLRINPKNLNPGDRSTWAAAIRSFQLPVYMLLHSEASGTPLEKISPAYLLLGKNKIDESIELPLGEDQETAVEVCRAAETVMVALIEEILNPDADFSPAADLEDECPRCPYRTICGTLWVKSWDQYRA
jgi:ATP-dependent helicase/nuclease subunit B